jgi:hypothetical protein
MKKQDSVSAFANPRMHGISEQYRRARRFVQLSRRCKKPATRFANLIAAVYPARAIVELMLEAAAKQELRKFHNNDNTQSRKDFEEVLAPKLPHYYLLEKIRIHDFHRFGCLPPDPHRQHVFLGGTIKLKANKGIAALKVSAKGPESVETGNSSIQQQRPLYVQYGRLYEEETGKWLSLEQLLEEYLNTIPQAIAYFQILRAG